MDQVIYWFEVKRIMEGGIELVGLFIREADARRWVCTQGRPEDFVIDEIAWYWVSQIVVMLAQGKEPRIPGEYIKELEKG
jgi:hypothetical protein